MNGCGVVKEKILNAFAVWDVGEMVVGVVEAMVVRVEILEMLNMAGNLKL